MGERFGQYELLEPLASGGMARVYRARMVGALGFEKIVAIKFMLPSFAADPEAVKMFVDEARLAATLSHANVVGILDFGNRDGTYYIAMEYVSGANLRVLLRRAGETERWCTRTLAAFVCQEVARGLDYAHKKTDTEGRPLSIVHRDVSPQNIVVSWTGEVKILDFGIARSRQRTTETNAGTIKGKYSYMSPEQASGMPVDHRSDIFSLGLVLYELLTWQRAYPQPGPAVLPRVRAADFIPPERLKPDLSPKLLHILHRALARDPENRYPSAGDMMDDLSLYLAEERLKGAKDGVSSSLARWAEEIFSASENDFGTKVLASAPAPVVSHAEKSVLPGWESEPAPPPKMPRVDLTFSGAESAEDEEAIVDEPPIGTKFPAFVAPPTSPFAGDVSEKPTKETGGAVSNTFVAAKGLPAAEAAPAAADALRRELPAFKPVPRATKPAPAAPPPEPLPPEPAPSLARRNAVVFAGGAGVALLLLGAGGLWIAVDRPDATPTPPAPTATASATATPSPTETPTPQPTNVAVADTSALFAAVAGTEPVGLLNLSSVPPGAEVWVDGKKIDRTPTLIPDLPAPKRYLVEFRKDGYADWSREVDILDDTAVVVEARLFPPEVPGKIKFRVPAKVTAYVDGRKVGTGPMSVSVDVQPGPHQVRLRDANDILIRQYELLVTSGRISELDIPPL